MILEPWHKFRDKLIQKVIKDALDWRHLAFWATFSALWFGKLPCSSYAACFCAIVASKAHSYQVDHAYPSDVGGP